MDFEVDAAAVLEILIMKARTEPLLAAWIEAAQWQAVAIANNQNETDDD